MNITQHFTLEEFERSATARCLGISNTIPQSLIPSITNLCTEILEPLRMFVAQPVVISSGYRCPRLNSAVGGSPTSQHMRGEACDIRIPSVKEGKEWMRWIMDNTSFDQLIWERNAQGTFWIHVSCKLRAEDNRHKVISMIKILK